MGSTYIWYPASTLKTALAVDVPIKQDELFSSWLIRMALANGCGPMSISSWFWDRWRLWSVDLDRGLSAERMDMLAKKCGRGSEADFEPMFLKDALKQVGPASLFTQGVFPWLLAIGARNRLRKGGLQYCPQCFSENDPFFHIGYRMAWHTCCEKHNILLRDRCPHCNMPVEPHRLEAQDRRLSVCASCHGNLTDVKSEPSHKDALQFQMLANDAIRKGVGKYGDLDIPSVEWFELCRFFVARIKLSDADRRSSMMEFRKVMGLDLEINRGEIPPLEMAQVNDRAKLLGSVYKLLQQGRDCLVENLEQCSVSIQSLLGQGGKSLPVCLQGALSSLLSNSRCRRKGGRSHRDLPLPRPIHEVKKKHLHLSRKLAAMPS